MNKIILLIPLVFSFISGCSQPNIVQPVEKKGSKIIPAAERMDLYLPLISGRRVALFANNTSMVGHTHLVDTLVKKGITVKKIFAPEHGFRGKADAGEKVSNSVDPRTGIPIISLYGQKRKPSAADLQDIDIIIFDIQDVGARFFTYISSLEDLMESAIENDKPLIVLDRPNPNGFYVDGPVMKKPFRSFLGMQQIPVVYGMTIGEYALMLIGEKWIDSSLHPKLLPKSGFTGVKVIPNGNYDHLSKYSLPVKASPNLPDMASVYLYPSTCFFEGTALNEGRGTDKAFQVFGHPSLPKNRFSYTPRSIEGARSPKLLNQVCYGWNLGGPVGEVLKKVNGRLQLKWLKEAYDLFPVKDSFFINEGRTFNRLAGNDILIRQVREGKTEEQIRETWQPDLANFKKIRKKYLLYKDFE